MMFDTIMGGVSKSNLEYTENSLLLAPDSLEFNEWVIHFSDSASELDNIIKEIVNKAQNIL
jgi:hypothetical protein